MVVNRYGSTTPASLSLAFQRIFGLGVYEDATIPNPIMMRTVIKYQVIGNGNYICFLGHMYAH